MLYRGPSGCILFRHIGTYLEPIAYGGGAGKPAHAFHGSIAKSLEAAAAPEAGRLFRRELAGVRLRVSYNGRKSWIVLYRCDGVKGRLTLGRFDVVPLA